MVSSSLILFTFHDGGRTHGGKVNGIRRKAGPTRWGKEPWSKGGAGIQDKAEGGALGRKKTASKTGEMETKAKVHGEESSRTISTACYVGSMFSAPNEKRRGFSVQRQQRDLKESTEDEEKVRIR